MSCFLCNCALVQVCCCIFVSCSLCVQVCCYLEALQQDLLAVLPQCCERFVSCSVCVCRSAAIWRPCSRTCWWCRHSVVRNCSVCVCWSTAIWRPCSRTCWWCCPQCCKIFVSCSLCVQVCCYLEDLLVVLQQWCKIPICELFSVCLCRSAAIWTPGGPAAGTVGGAARVL